MANDDRTPRPENEGRPPEGGGGPVEDEDGFVPDLLKRAIQSGFRTVHWGSEKVGAVGATLNTVRQEVVGVVGREIVRYLDRLNLTEEAVKVLTAISLEVRTEIRFIPNDKKLVSPDVEGSVTVKRGGETLASGSVKKGRRRRKSPTGE